MVDKSEPNEVEKTRPVCGLIMPIATIGDYHDSHWSAVEKIFTEAIHDAGFQAKIVSQETAAGVIHQRIITNLYDNEIVVCDVSARNPNVMFELGMRLAFDKATVIVKDDDTPFSFDIAAIEHLSYPRSLRYSDIVEFKEKLRDKVSATYKASKRSGYSTFLKHVGGVVPAKLDIQEIPIQDYLSRQLEGIIRRLDRIESGSTKGTFTPQLNQTNIDSFKFYTSPITDDQINNILVDLNKNVVALSISHRNENGQSVFSVISLKGRASPTLISAIVEKHGAEIREVQKNF